MATKTSNHLFSTSVNLSEDTRSEVIELLNARLADTVDLKTQAKQAHWNVKGKHFLQLHELFDQVAEHVDAHADTLAERVTALGGIANGTARQAAALSSLQEYDLNAVTGDEHLRALVARVAAATNAFRAAIDRSDELGDKVTADIFTQIAGETDKDLWFLEAHLQ